MLPVGPRMHAGVRVALVAAASCLSACDDPTGRVYVTSGATDHVVVLDARDGTHVTDLAVDRRVGETDEPHGIAVSPDGRHLYVTLAHGEPSLWKFERDGHRLVGRLSLDMVGAARIAVSADGRTGYVADYDRASGGAPGEVLAVDLHDLLPLARARPCAGPHDARPDPTGALVAVACSVSDEVVLLDAVTMAPVRRIGLRSEDHASPAGDTLVQRPMNIAWVDSAEFAVTMAARDELVLFDVDGRALGAVGVGRSPAQVAYDERRDSFVVANRGDGTASVVARSPLTERLRVPLDVAQPHGVDIEPRSGRAYVTFEGTSDTGGGVVAVDPTEGRVLWRAAAGSYTLGVAYGEGAGGP